MTRIVYPRLLLLCMSFVFAYLLYMAGLFDAMHGVLRGMGYVSIFLAGLLFSYGFTTPFAIALFVEMAWDVNPWIAAPLAGLGALIADLVIVSLMRTSLLHTEIVQLRRNIVIRKIRWLLKHEHIPERVRRAMVFCFAGLIIASPLPDEFGVALVESVADVDTKYFAVLSFVLNTLGIVAILMIARA